MKNYLRQTFDDRLQYYQSQHRTLGCKITHMVGVPIIALSFPVYLFNRRLANQMQQIGWSLQFIGHFVFEHNKPVFLQKRDPFTVLAAVVFVAHEWQLALGGQQILNEKAHNGRVVKA